MLTNVFRRAWAVLALSALGCGYGASEGASEPDGMAVTAYGAEAVDPMRDVLADRGPWTTQSTDGTRVTLSAEPAPPSAGPVKLIVAVDAAASEARPVSVDLVSPTMPLHGVVRYDLVEGEAGIHVPMEGRWALHVNLDEIGTNSAEFLFDVEPSGGSAHHSRHPPVDSP